MVEGTPETGLRIGPSACTRADKEDVHVLDLAALDAPRKYKYGVTHGKMSSSYAFTDFAAFSLTKDLRDVLQKQSH